MLNRMAASPLKSLLSCYRWRILSLSLARPLSDAWCNKKPLAGLRFPLPWKPKGAPRKEIIRWQNKGTAHLLFTSLLKLASYSCSLVFWGLSFKPSKDEWGLQKPPLVSMVENQTRNPSAFYRWPQQSHETVCLVFWTINSYSDHGVTSACLTLTDVVYIHITRLKLLRSDFFRIVYKHKSWSWSFQVRPEPLSYVVQDGIHTW